MFIDDVIINCLILKQYLNCLPNQTWDSVEKLLNPADPQDVPCAIELIHTVGNLHSLDKSTFNPSQLKTVEALQLIRTLFHAMTEPFINAELSLTTQMTFLSEFVHLLLVLYRCGCATFGISHLGLCSHIHR
jgi:hypothetical protein